METILTQQIENSENVKLRKASYNDEAIVVNILCKSFENDPHMKWMLEKSSNTDKLRIIMTYIFRKTIRIDRRLFFRFSNRHPFRRAIGGTGATPNVMSSTIDIQVVDETPPLALNDPASQSMCELTG